MGWALQCKGADLLRSLRKAEDAVLGRRYALYILALAAEVDEEAIQWLCEFGRPVDSLTAHGIAFLVFSNSTRFYATSDPRSRESVDHDGSRRLFDRGTGIIDVPRHDIEGSRALTDWAEHRFHSTGASFPREALVRSMTYESDEVARCLGISPAELPCFVFIDDPGGKDYFVVPMEPLGKALFSKLCRIVGAFYSADSNRTYLELLHR